jgi:hypothetical protein
MQVQGLMPTTKTQIYTCPASTKGQVKTILIHNYNPDDSVVVRLYSKKATSLQFDAFLLLSGHSIEKSPSFPLEYLETEGIEGEASIADSVNYLIGGVESAV